MALVRFFITTVRGRNSRSRKGFLSLPDTISDSALDTVIANYEALTCVGGGGDNTVDGASVYGCTQAIYYVSAADDILEPTDAASKNPYGMNGYMFKSLHDLGGGTGKRVQPWTLVGLDRDSDLLTGGVKLEDVVKDFLKNGSSVLSRDMSGNLVKETPDKVIITSTYLMN